MIVDGKEAYLIAKVLALNNFPRLERYTMKGEQRRSGLSPDRIYTLPYIDVFKERIS